MKYDLELPARDSQIKSESIYQLAGILYWARVSLGHDLPQHPACAYARAEQVPQDDVNAKAAQKPLVGS